MSGIVKVTVSLPYDLFASIERERRSLHQSRSEYLRDIVGRHLRSQQERADDEAYVRAYQEMPETEEELAWGRIGLAALEEVPWE